MKRAYRAGVALIVLSATSGCSSNDSGKRNPGTGGAPVGGGSGSSGAPAGVVGGESGVAMGGAGPIGAGGARPAAGGKPPLDGMGGSGPGTAGSSAAGAGATGGAGGMSPADSGAAGNGAGDADSPSRKPASSLSLPVTKESPQVDPFFNVYRPQDLNATGQPLPLVVWVDGGCARADDPWATLFNRWAAGGFVVLALTTSPNGEKPIFQGTDDAVKDQGALIDWGLQKAPFAAKIDTKRIIAAGNSCGGVTALVLASKDPRVTAVFVLSGSSALGATDKNVMGGISVPIGYITGKNGEDIAAPNALTDYDATKDGVPVMLVSRASGDHITVSTDVMILKDEATISLNWIDLAINGTKEAYDELLSPGVCASCMSGPWSMKSKNLEKLRR